MITDITLKSAERSLLSTHDGSHFSPKQSPEQYASDRLEEGIKWSASKGETIVSQGSKKAAKKKAEKTWRENKERRSIVLLNRVETVELKEIHKQNVKLIYELKQKKR